MVYKMDKSKLTNISVYAYNGHMIENIGERGIRILLLLHNKREAKLTQIKNELRMGSAAAYNALAQLFRFGLVEEYRYKNMRIIRLTEKGIKVADLLIQADKILSEE